MPSVRAVRLAVAIGLLALAVPLWPQWAVLFWAAVASLASLCLLDRLFRPAPGALEVSRGPLDLAHVAYEFAYTLRLTNRTRLGLRVALREALPPAVDGKPLEQGLTLAAGETVELPRSWVPLRRGSLQLPALGVGVSRGLQMLEHRWSVLGDDEVQVAPGRPAGESGWLLAHAEMLDEAGDRLVRQLGSDWEFEHHRDYVVGDELRAMDWRAAARRHRPVVRVYQRERNAEVILALDCGRLMGHRIHGVDKLDLAMVPILDVAAVALRRGDRVGFLGFDSQPRSFVPPRGGIRQMERLIAEMARLPPPAKATSYLRAFSHLEATHRKRALVIVFTDFLDEVTAGEMSAGLVSLARRHRVLFVGVSDPHVGEVFRNPGRNESALFEKGVAGQLLVERRRTLNRVQRLGIPVLDADPRQLTAGLLNLYLQHRGAGVS